MSKQTSIFKDNDMAAHEVLRFIRSLGITRFTSRPFNRFDTAFTEWWLVPSNEWPAYRFGKLCFHRYPRSAGGLLYAGYYVEKGLGPSLAGLPDVQRKHIMQSNWYWNRFVEKALQGEVDKVLGWVCDQSQADVRVLIEAHAFNKVPEPDIGRNVPSDTVEFNVSALSAWQLIQAGQNALSPLNEATNMSNLTKRLREMEKALEFFWLDCVVCIRLHYGSGSSGWNAAELWMKALKPWLNFVG